MSNVPHRGCVADQRDEAAAARRAFVRDESVFGASLTSPAEDPADRWAIELSIVGEPGLPPRLMDVARCRGLTAREVVSRSPTEVRAVLTL